MKMLKKLLIVLMLVLFANITISFAQGVVITEENLKRLIYNHQVAYERYPAGAIIPDTCSGLLQYKSTNNQYDYLAFDGATDEYATFTWIPPDNWDRRTIKAKFIWAASATMTNGHTVIWGLACKAISDGDSLADALTSGEQVISDAYATGDETGPILKITSATSAITVQGTPAIGDMIYCRIHRDADTDTSTVDTWLLGVKFEYSKTVPVLW
jgi:hypothetical protein